MVSQTAGLVRKKKLPSKSPALLGLKEYIVILTKFKIRFHQIMQMILFSAFRIKNFFELVKD